MLNFLMPLVKNPLARLVVSKTIEKVSHHLEKEKIIRVREIEAAKTVSVEQIKASTSSWKDEYLVLTFGIILICHFLPFTQDYMERGWTILSKADPLFWYSILALISGSFGLNLTNKIRNGKKK
ncbi:hypothetical protein [uncultured phage_Deep-GF0-KM16-C193]|uniref:Holin of 3TMs, for gene-transfer release n=1 Tax=uncultured phage_Deep-GF0-KM16-C193 TaxID=2740799 RepID=A0A1B1IWP6_9CAUD|nr:hypothetical protein HOU06_gp08 [uncultured phage_Deep-GF0-KM16-C193]ANS05742.1 hypothetical protein [uncultured phage_Deep-GF0-KM16-C193]